MATCQCGSTSQIVEDDEFPMTAATASSGDTSGRMHQTTHRMMTPLFRAIEQENWEGVLLFLKTGTWSSSMFRSNSEDMRAPSPQIQCQTWVTQYNLNGDVAWSQLPLHAAISYGAPYVVIHQLIEMYPKALVSRDNDGMLPIHLAFGFNSPDSVLAMMLEYAPSTINERGRDGRFPYECCELGPNKIRGKVYSILANKVVERTRGEVDEDWKQFAEVVNGATTTDSSRRDDHRVDVANRMLSETTKTNERVEELTKELESMKAALKQMAEEAQTKKDVEDLKTLVDEKLQEARGLAKTELSNMKSTVDNIYADLKTSKTKEEVYELKKELETLKDGMKQIEEVGQAKKDIEDLKASVEAELKKARGATKVELNVMKKSLDNLFSDMNRVNKIENFIDLKVELEGLQKEMREFQDAAQTKKDIEELKATLEKEMDEARGATREELATMKTAVDNIHAEINRSQTKDEVLQLKETLESLKEGMKKLDEAEKTKQEVEDLRAALAKEIEQARGETKTELELMKKAVDGMHAELSADKTSDEVLTLKAELRALKNKMQAKDDLEHLKVEVKRLRDFIEVELSHNDGNATEELAQMIRMVTTVDEEDLASKTFEELYDLKNEVDAWKHAILVKEEARMKAEVTEVQVLIEGQLAQWDGKIKEELSLMHATVKALIGSSLTDVSSDEWADIKSDLNRMKTDVETAQENFRIKDELETMKQTLDAEVKLATGSRKSELSEMKAIVDRMQWESYGINDLAWDRLGSNLETLKEEFKDKDIGSLMTSLQREIETLRMAQESLKAKQKKGILRLFSPFSHKRNKKEENQNPAPTVAKKSDSKISKEKPPVRVIHTTLLPVNKEDDSEVEAILSFGVSPMNASHGKGSVSFGLQKSKSAVMVETEPSENIPSAANVQTSSIIEGKGLSDQPDLKEAPSTIRDIVPISKSITEDEVETLVMKIFSRALAEVTMCHGGKLIE